MALGFVVARFGLFLSVIAASASPAHEAPAPHGPSTVLGIVLVLFGAFTILAALHNHRSYVRTLPAADRPELRLPWLTSFLCLSVSMLGVLLAGYLAAA